MMIQTQTELLIAAHGWSHAAWCGEYYPEDLPEDWRLSYYSNEFRGVVVPAEEWVMVDPVEVERWVEDTPEEFTFYIEVTDLLTDWAQFADKAKPLGDHLGGILLRPPELDVDLGLAADSLDAAAALAPTSLLLPEGLEPSVSGLGLLTKYGVELCWSVAGAETVPPWRGERGLALARVAGNLTYTPRQWRETIEACLHSALEHQTVLVMIERPAVEQMRAAMMIGDLLTAPVPE
jgi:hypothetical protein